MSRSRSLSPTRSRRHSYRNIPEGAVRESHELTRRFESAPTHRSFTISTATRGSSSRSRSLSRERDHRGQDRRRRRASSASSVASLSDAESGCDGDDRNNDTTTLHITTSLRDGPNVGDTLRRNDIDEDEPAVTSAEWLKVHGVHRRRLTRTQLVERATKAHAARSRSGTALGVSSTHGLDATLEDKSGRVTRLHISDTTLATVRDDLDDALKRTTRRLRWLCAAGTSRAVFGTIVEPCVVFVIDMSDAARPFANLLKRHLHALVDEQLGSRTRINMIAYGEDIDSWRRACTFMGDDEDDVASAHAWIDHLVAYGRATALVALEEALFDANCDAVYWIGASAVLGLDRDLLVRRVLQLSGDRPVHTVAYETIDAGAIDVLRATAAATRGRYHRTAATAEGGSMHRRHHGGRRRAVSLSTDKTRGPLFVGDDIVALERELERIRDAQALVLRWDDERAQHIRHAAEAMETRAQAERDTVRLVRSKEQEVEAQREQRAGPKTPANTVTVDVHEPVSSAQWLLRAGVASVDRALVRSRSSTTSLDCIDEEVQKLLARLESMNGNALSAREQERRLARLARAVGLGSTGEGEEAERRAAETGRVVLCLFRRAVRACARDCSKRIAWLQRGSRLPLGVLDVVSSGEHHWAVVVDVSGNASTSGCTDDMCSAVATMLRTQLVRAQRSSTFNVYAARGSRVDAWSALGVEVSPETAERAAQYCESLTSERRDGPCDLVGALRCAVSDSRVDCVLVVGCGLPRSTVEELEDAVQAMGESVTVDTVAFGGIACDGNTAEVLACVAHASGPAGRAHRYAAEGARTADGDDLEAMRTHSRKCRAMQTHAEMAMEALGVAVGQDEDDAVDTLAQFDDDEETSTGEEGAEERRRRLLTVGVRAGLRASGGGAQVVLAEQRVTSLDWLKLHGLEPRRLGMFSHLSADAFRHIVDYLEGVDTTIRLEQCESVFARHCSIEGTLVGDELDVFVARLVSTVQLYRARLRFLTHDAVCSDDGAGMWGCIAEKRVVFLLDASSSMLERLTRAAEQLVHTVDRQLGDDDYFNVVVFGGEFSQAFATEHQLVAATRANRRRLRRWLLSGTLTSAHGTTNVAEALEQAGAHDDVHGVYLLVDGPPAQTVETLVDVWRRSGLAAQCAPVHCIALDCGVQSGTCDTLQRLGRATGGRWQQVEGVLVEDGEDVRLVQTELDRAEVYLDFALCWLDARDGAGAGDAVRAELDWELAQGTRRPAVATRRGRHEHESDLLATQRERTRRRLATSQRAGHKKEKEEDGEEEEEEEEEDVVDLPAVTVTLHIRTIGRERIERDNLKKERDEESETLAESMPLEAVPVPSLRRSVSFRAYDEAPVEVQDHSRREVDEEAEALLGKKNKKVKEKAVETKEGISVLARWDHNGLYYQGRIVEESSDGMRQWVEFVGEPRVSSGQWTGREQVLVEKVSGGGYAVLRVGSCVLVRLDGVWVPGRVTAVSSEGEGVYRVRLYHGDVVVVYRRGEMRGVGWERYRAMVRYIHREVLDKAVQTLRETLRRRVGNADGDGDDNESVVSTSVNGVTERSQSGRLLTPLRTRLRGAQPSQETTRRSLKEVVSIAHRGETGEEREAARRELQARQERIRQSEETRAMVREGRWGALAPEGKRSRGRRTVIEAMREREVLRRRRVEHERRWEVFESGERDARKIEEWYASRGEPVVETQEEVTQRRKEERERERERTRRWKAVERQEAAMDREEGAVVYRMRKDQRRRAREDAAEMQQKVEATRRAHGRQVRELERREREADARQWHEWRWQEEQARVREVQVDRVWDTAQRRLARDRAQADHDAASARKARDPERPLTSVRLNLTRDNVERRRPQTAGEVSTSAVARVPSTNYQLSYRDPGGRGVTMARRSEQEYLAAQEQASETVATREQGVLLHRRLKRHTRELELEHSREVKQAIETLTSANRRVAQSAGLAALQDTVDRANRRELAAHERARRRRDKYESQRTRRGLDELAARQSQVRNATASSVRRLEERRPL